MDKKERVEVVKLISQVVNSLSEKEEGIPISIFRTKGISGLEAIVVYLKDVQKLKVKEIASLLNRELSTIYTTYELAKTKLKKEIDISDDSVLVPLSIFSNRKYAVLESLVFYLKNEKKFSMTEISKILNKSYSTIKTSNKRYNDKK